MQHKMTLRYFVNFGGRRWDWLLLFLIAASAPQIAKAEMLDDRYFGLSTGLCKTAVLTMMDAETLLQSDGLTITRAQPMKAGSVSEKETRAFYAASKEMVGGASFDQVADNIRQYLLQVFYDAAAEEVFRHVGFFAQTAVDKQLAAMGLKE